MATRKSSFLDDIVTKAVSDQEKKEQEQKAKEDYHEEDWGGSPSAGASAGASTAPNTASNTASNTAQSVQQNQNSQKQPQSAREKQMAAILNGKNQKQQPSEMKVPDDLKKELESQRPTHQAMASAVAKADAESTVPRQEPAQVSESEPAPAKQPSSITYAQARKLGTLGKSSQDVYEQKFDRVINPGQSGFDGDSRFEAVEGSYSDFEGDMGSYSRSRLKMDSGAKYDAFRLDDGVKAPVSMIKKFPKAVLRMIQKDFPGESQTDALLAWVVVHAGYEFMRECGQCLTDHQLSLVKSHLAASELSMNQMLGRLERRMQEMDYGMSTLELLLSFLVFDRVGNRQEIPQFVKDVNLLEHGVMDVILRAEDQTRSMRHERGIKKGRPVK